MCGIVGYIGSKQASPVLIEGLERLSYRGYDSAGVAVIGPEGRISVRKAKGRLENLKKLLAQSPVEGVIGIGHTRWATHGEPSDLNAHPHTDVKGGIAVVHNGIIENHESLRRYLESTGARFVSQTDTEVIAHLLNHLYQGDMRRALIRAMGMLEGSYALGVICDQEPNALFCARNDSPLVIGAKDGEGFIASDIPALLSHTRDVIFLQDKEIGVLDRQGVSVYDAYGKTRQHAIFHVDWDLSSAEKGGYAHYMQYEKQVPARSRWWHLLKFFLLLWVLAVLFACFCILASFGIGNMSQINSIAGNMNAAFGVPTLVTGLCLMVVTALIVIGGLKRVAAVTEKLVPIMALFYIIGCVIILVMNASAIPNAFVQIFTLAFQPQAIAGGVASNSSLRAAFEEECGKRNIAFYHPSPIFCTDNAAMIGVAGYYEYIKGVRSGYDLNAVPNLKLGER